MRIDLATFSYTEETDYVWVDEQTGEGSGYPIIVRFDGEVIYEAEPHPWMDLSEAQRKARQVLLDRLKVMLNDDNETR